MYKYLNNTIKPYFTVTYEVPFMKDSRDVTQKDREILLERIENSPADKIIITHGTYTLVETAEFLLDHFEKDSLKKVILTGSMCPLELPQSDAAFNIGFACHAVMSTPPGVWIAFNGDLWYPKGLMKNVSESRFELSAPQSPSGASQYVPQKKLEIER